MIFAQNISEKSEIHRDGNSQISEFAISYYIISGCKNFITLLFNQKLLIFIIKIQTNMDSETTILKIYTRSISNGN